MLSWIPIQPPVSMSSRVYTIRWTTPNEFIISVMINSDATNTILAKGWKMSVEFFEVSISIFMRITETNICITYMNIRHNIAKINIIYPFIMPKGYLASSNSSNETRSQDIHCLRDRTPNARNDGYRSTYVFLS